MARRPDWNPDTSKRDPRVDPKPGDVLGIGRVRFYVFNVSIPGEVAYTHREPPKIEPGAQFRAIPPTWYVAPIANWRRRNRRPDVFVYNVAEVSP